MARKCSAPVDIATETSKNSGTSNETGINDLACLAAMIADGQVPLELDEINVLDRRFLIAEVHRQRRLRLVRYIGGAIAADIDRVIKSSSKGAQHENT